MPQTHLSKTSVVSTLGPASGSREVIAALVREGVSVFRLNFSHGTFDDHAATLANINEVRASLPYSIAVMGDLCGPKIRVGTIAPGTVLQDGSEITISIGDETGDHQHFSTGFASLVDDVDVGQRILLDDGQLVLGVVGKDAGSVRCKVLVGGPLSSRKGMNLPDTQLSVEPITPKDWKCVDWAVANGLDYLSLSFVQRADEIHTLKTYLEKQGSPIKIIAKIEKPLAVENIDSILHASDAIMVARGDLGVEMDLAQVPLVQKKITDLCRRYAKPVIVATQVLQSMIENASPTRAEATDVYTAVTESADAVMLSGETAVGKYPLAAVKTLGHICKTTEHFIEQQNVPRERMDMTGELRKAEAVARSVAHMLDEIEAAFVVIWVENETMARLLSKARIDIPILSLCPDRTTARQLSLCYGVVSVYHGPVSTYEEWIGAVETTVTDNGWAAKGQKLLLIPPQAALSKNTTGAIIMHTIA